MKKFLQILFLSLGFVFFMGSSFGNGVFADGTENSAKMDYKNSFDLNTLFTNEHLSADKKGIQTVEGAIGAIVKLITGIIGGFAVLGSILGGFFILISGGNDELVTKGKKIIKTSLIGLSLSLASYTLIQLVQLFLFSFSK